MVNNPNEFYTEFMIAIFLWALDFLELYIVMLILHAVMRQHTHTVWRMYNLFVLHIFCGSFMFLCISVLFHSLFLKGSQSPSNTVFSQQEAVQSAAPRSGPRILSPSSRLFKRAKAQQCRFLNTQVLITNRGLAVWQKSLFLSLALSFFHSLASPWTLTPSSHYPNPSIDLSIPWYSPLAFFCSHLSFPSNHTASLIVQFIFRCFSRARSLSQLPSRFLHSFQLSSLFTCHSIPVFAASRVPLHPRYNSVCSASSAFTSLSMLSDRCRA